MLLGSLHSTRQQQRKKHQQQQQQEQEQEHQLLCNGNLSITSSGPKANRTRRQSTATITTTITTAAAAAAAAAAATATRNFSSGCCSAGATDFSIAAIMARGGHASSREPSERSLSPLSVERYTEVDDDVDVDVVDCSDSEVPTMRGAAARGMSHQSSLHPSQHHLYHHHHHLQQQHHQQHHPQHQHHHQQQPQSPSPSQPQPQHKSTRSRHHHNNNNNNNNNNSGSQFHSNSSNNNNNSILNSSTSSTSSSRSRGRVSPSQSPATTEEDRLTPEEPVEAAPKIVGSCNCDDLAPVQCHLETKELWDKFHDLGTEMIITKTGRRMFPTVRVSFSGPLRQIQPADRYAVLIDIVAMDSRRYRYAYHRSSWLVAGKADPPPPARLYAHPDSPISCEALRKQVVSFEKVKLTNNEMDKSGQIVLNSMHRYQPRIHLVRLSHGQSIPNTPKELLEMDHKTFVFPETVFTAVTAYQNQLITKLKIDSNPFAKGFRDSSRLSDFDRDPMDALLLEQHLRSPLRFFPDPFSQQLTAQDADAASLAFIEKARQHLQLFGRSPYTEMLLPHLYQRPPTLGAFNLGMWQQQWPQLTAGFLASANQQAAAAQAAAAANQAAANAAAAAASLSSLTPPPPAPASTPSSSGSPSPDMRAKHFQRFSPYQVPQHSPGPARTPPN